MFGCWRISDVDDLESQAGRGTQSPKIKLTEPDNSVLHEHIVSQLSFAVPNELSWSKSIPTGSRWILPTMAFQRVFISSQLRKAVIDSWWRESGAAPSYTRISRSEARYRH
jgi:hypothetical protein